MYEVLMRHTYTCITTGTVYICYYKPMAYTVNVAGEQLWDTWLTAISNIR